jgi:DNA-binding SARP family transcriptional activator/pimeloyl-ACP methyl ester carboxylesterase
VEFSVLGPVEARSDGRLLRLGSARARAVLALLLAHPGQVISADRLADELWPAQQARTAVPSLQVRISELRKAFRSAGEPDRLATHPAGYSLTLGPADCDATRFAALAADGTAALAAGDAVAAVERLDEALGLWRGQAFADVDAPSVLAEAGRLHELRLSVQESRADALLACGRHAELAGDLEVLTAAHPLRERLWSARMLALYRAGRQADSLRAYGDLRAILASELAIEPGPDLRDLHARILRQDPSLDHRAIRASPGPAPQTRYVQTVDGIHIAYQIVGSGQRDIVFVPGLMSHLELLWEDPETAAFFRRLATMGRLILFDKRDTGLSDRAPAASTLEERMDDVAAVMRAAGSSEAVLFGYSEGAPMSILFAATYPERVSSLILGSAAARWFPAADYPCGRGSDEAYLAMREIATHRWGQGDTIDWYLPSRAGSLSARQLIGRFERLAVSPSSFLRMLEMIRDIDVRAVLPAIHVPTLVIQRSGDRINPPCHGKYLASHISGARYVEQPGDHSLRFGSSGDSDALFAAITDFLADASRRPEPGRVLATLMVARVAGDSATWQLVGTHRGRVIKHSAGAVLAAFDAPGHAIRCAAALRATYHDLGAGIHAGEVDLAGGEMSGTSVDLAYRIAVLAGPGEILVSRTVTDLLAGSDIDFAARGSHPQGGPDGDWPLFTVTQPGR